MVSPRGRMTATARPSASIAASRERWRSPQVNESTGHGTGQAPASSAPVASCDARLVLSMIAISLPTLF